MTGTLIVQILCIYILIIIKKKWNNNKNNSNSNHNHNSNNDNHINLNYIKLTHVPPATWKFPYDTYRSARLGLFQQGLVDSTLKNIPNGGWIM